ncbi:MAG: M15 family metallopeptidase [Pseudomonadota bacterium]
MSHKNANDLPEGFVYLKEVIPNINIDMRYYGINNFLGVRVDGYEKPVCIISKPAAYALKNAQEELNLFNLALKVFDCYRPQRAVDHFARWAEEHDDIKAKADYYPDLEKKDLIIQGYIAMKSSHSRGSTADLTIIDLDTLEELDMGTQFDFFSPKSWLSDLTISSKQRTNRMLLQQVMTKYGFKPFNQEWWHFTLKDEPYPNDYFDFPVK